LLKKTGDLSLTNRRAGEQRSRGAEENNYQLSIINYQLSIINYQLSIINYQLSIINYRLSRHPPIKWRLFVVILLDNLTLLFPGFFARYKCQNEAKQ
jgi:hypothetical protein